MLKDLVRIMFLYIVGFIPSQEESSGLSQKVDLMAGRLGRSRDFVWQPVERTGKKGIPLGAFELGLQTANSTCKDKYWCGTEDSSSGWEKLTQGPVIELLFSCKWNRFSTATLCSILASAMLIRKKDMFMNRKESSEYKPGKKRSVWDTCSLISEIKAAGGWWTVSDSAAGKASSTPRNLHRLLLCFIRFVVQVTQRTDQAFKISICKCTYMHTVSNITLFQERNIIPEL